MLVNFLHPALKPLIESNIVSSEGFELSNLVSADKQLFQKGFLAERFISGPVTIRFTFVCPVNVKYILIWPQVGNQKSSGFELSLLNDNNDCKRFASGTIPNEKNGILFSAEGSRIDFDAFFPEVKSFERSTFFRSKINENVRMMQIKIFRSHFVPAIKKIEVWGEPHRTCDAETKKRIAKVWSSAHRSIACRKDIQVLTSSIENEHRSLDNVEIPDDFYDEITHELMTLPMILPSGKIIDYRTLGRFQAEEAKWGRLPSDPFTGVLFTERSKPVVATALKSKIDLFLIKYSDTNDFKYIPRRLGSQDEKFNSPNFHISKIVEPVASKRKLSESGEMSVFKNQKLDVNVEEKVPFANIISADDSMNKLLEKTLLNLPSFITASSNVKTHVGLRCLSCFILIDLYRLPCSHIQCRSCLTKTENECNDCKKKFSFGEIQKIHVNRPCDKL